MNSEILDYRLQHYFRNVIKELPYNQQMQLKNLRLCNTKTIPQLGVREGVYLLRNENGEAKFFGQMTCKNTWACPHCSAIKMKNYATKIAAAIDALDNQYFGFMATFTIPHLNFMSCNEVTDILYATWREAFVNSTTRRKCISDSKRYRYTSPVNKMYIDLGIKHFIRVGEYTWGKNGWHPHFHVIFFVEKSKVGEILNYLQPVKEHWEKCHRKVALKYWQSHNLHISINHNNLLARLWRYTGSQAVDFSVDSGGKVRKVTSAAYLAGWSSDKEMTGNVRKQASHNGHYTPYQILELAEQGNEQFKKLYIEFALSTTRKPVHPRTMFSRTGLTAIIQNKLNTDGYKEVLKKKSNRANWAVVCWFTKQEWQHLCFECPYQTLSTILELAGMDRKGELRAFLASLNVKMSMPPKKIKTHIESIFNAA